jgi:hypothetical protein
VCVSNSISFVNTDFEHACHVTMAVDKFMSRIVTPDMDDSFQGKDHTGIAAHVHKYTHGINSDPITLFAIVFSALVHDTGTNSTRHGRSVHPSIIEKRMDCRSQFSFCLAY